MNDPTLFRIRIQSSLRTLANKTLSAFLIGLVGCWVTCISATATGDEIGFIEKFALAKDRESVLKELVPGTEDYYYFHCLHYQNTEQFEKVDKMLNRWIKSYDYQRRVRQSMSTRAREIVNRQILLTYPQNPQRSLDYLKRYLELDFNHQRESLGGPALPSMLDPNLIARDTLIRRAIGNQSGFQGFEKSALNWFFDSDLTKDRIYYGLQQLTLPDHPELVDMLNKFISEDTHEFGRIGIHRQLTKQQLLHLANLKPRLMNNSNFVTTYLTKIRPNPDIHFDSNRQAQKAHFDELWDFVKRLAPQFNTLKAHVLYHRLVFDRSQGIYDRERFLEYIKLPREASYIEPDYHRQRQFASYKVNFNANYQSQTLYRPIGNDEPLLRSYLHHFFVKDQDYKRYEKYLHYSYLKRNFAETKIVNGLGDPEQWASYISAVDYKSLRNRVDLDFVYTSKEQYSADDSVQIEMHVKNVQKLIVKVFEVNTSNYYRDQQAEIDTNIELDGLLPNHEYTFEYDESPFRRVLRKFDLPELKERGVYIVDFIGNRKSSRALIRKGRLRFIEKTTPAGHELTIVDTKNNVVKDASVWMSGTQRKSGENGRIFVPFSTQPGRTPMVISQGDFSSLDFLNHQAENYQLAVGFHVDRESLIDGEKATVIVRPQLKVNGIPASVSLLKDVRLMITSTDIEGSSSTKEVKDFKLFEDRESEYEFKVPKRLQGLTFALFGNVRNLSQLKDVPLSSSTSVFVNQIDTTVKVEDLFLSQINGEYVLDLLGKTGEQKVARPVQISLKHRDFKQPVTVALQTGMNGRIKLGPLSGIDSLMVNGPEGTSRSWKLLPARNTYYSSVHSTEGEEIEVALPLFDTRLSHQNVALLEQRGGTFTRNQFDKVRLENGLLKIKGLARGDYLLSLKNIANIQIRVSAGTEVKDHLVNRKRQLELKSEKPLQVVAVDQTKKQTVVKIANADEFTRVHVVATRFVPPFDLFRQLTLPDAEPSVAMLPQSQSLYVAGRKIGDEYQYILDRKYAEKYPGVMLKRPGLLLQPWAVRSTQTSRQDPRQGTAFDSADDSRPGSSSRGGGNKGKGTANTDKSSLDFLESGSILLTNLEVDKDGKVIIDNDLLEGRQHLHVCVLNPTCAAVRSQSFGEAALEPEDLRLVLGLDPDKRFARKKEITFVDAGDEFDVTDIATGEFEIYDNLPAVYQLFTSLSGDAKLAEFRFILDWRNKKLAEKLELYSEYACHELNFFLFHKDREFFDSVVEPYLANKKDKTFLDLYLTGKLKGAELTKFREPWYFNQLNVVERILLGHAIDEESKYSQRHVKEDYDLHPTSQQRFDTLFGFAVQGNALDADGDVLEGKLGAVREKLRDYAGLSNAEKERHRGTQPQSGMNGQVRPAPKPGAPAASAGRGGFGGGGAGGRSRSSARNSSADKDRAAAPAEETAKNDFANQLGQSFGVDKKNANRRQNLSRRSGKEAKQALEEYSEARAKVSQLFRQIDTTKEWAENNYYKLPIQQQNADLVKVNQFWRDFATAPIDEPFYSVNVAEASHNFTEMMLALSVLDLGWDNGKHDSQVDENKLTITADKALLIYHDQIRPAKDGRKETSVLVSQNFFRVDDRYRYEGPDRLDKFVTDEFIKRIAYGCQVVVTNPTSARQKIDLLLQIPRGSLPLNKTRETRSVHLELDPYRTSSIEYFFYFPESGSFDHYPVNVARNEVVIAFAETMKFNVVDQPSKVDKTSWAWISQFGTEADVIEYLNNHNLQRTDLAKIAWRMRDKAFFDQVSSILDRNHIFNPTLWAYSIYHDFSPGSIRRFLTYSDKLIQATGPYIDTMLLSNDRVARRTYEHLEYEPLVNARAHQLGQKRQILNDRFHAQYHRLLWILGCKPELGDVDKLAVSYYLLLQDRMSEAAATFSEVSSDMLSSQVQYDYMAAYLDMLNPEPTLARDISQRYANYPVDRWRKAFLEIGNQLDEIEGKDSQLVDDENRENVQDNLAAKTAAFDFKVDAREIELSFQNLDRVQVNYYVMDVELLFSRNPFVQRFSGELTFIRPRKSESIELPEGKQKHTWELPSELDRSNVLVEVSGGQQVKSQAYYAHAMNVQMIESYGQLKVADAKTGRQVPKTYCKVYAQMKDGTTRFYKDGYTDLRGRFDYTSLSTNDLDNVNRFSVLVMHDDLGATVREAIPPKR